MVVREQVPWFVTYIILPLTIPFTTFFSVLALIGLYAQIYKKELNKSSVIGGIVLFLILLLTIIIPRIYK
ncbi:hypothetical protein [Bacillus horti]|nr:hypothetical protein [Bacillus horti]